MEANGQEACNCTEVMLSNLPEDSQAPENSALWDQLDQIPSKNLNQDPTGEECGFQHQLLKISYHLLFLLGVPGSETSCLSTVINKELQGWNFYWSLTHQEGGS